MLQRWVWAFKQDRFLVSINTNNGTERQNESLKYQYLKDRNNNSLSGMITVVTEEYFPDKYRRYSNCQRQTNITINHFEVGNHFIMTKKKAQLHSLSEVFMTVCLNFLNLIQFLKISQKFRLRQRITL